MFLLLQPIAPPERLSARLRLTNIHGLARSFGRQRFGVAKKRNPKEIVETATKQLGPGLATGAADDDPSGIATYSQAGAQFGFSLLWTVLLTTPFMIAIQLVSAESALSSARVLPPTPKRARPGGSCSASFRCCSPPTPSTSPPISPRWEALYLLVGGLRHEHTLIFAAASVVLRSSCLVTATPRC
jgi:hypothetical protein